MIVLCDYCQKPAELVDDDFIYGRSYGRKVWRCVPCDAYVGTHRNSRSHAPLGRLANRELRAWKCKAHEMFDQLWKGLGMTRKEAYSWMQETMGLSKSEAHIGKFDVDQCKALIENIRKKDLDG